MKVMHRLRLSQQDAHYGGNLVDGAKIMALFGDVATELLIQLDGDEGLFKAYDMVEFVKPIYAGDFIEVEGEITRIGQTSRAMLFKCYKVITSRPDINESAADHLNERVLAVQASGTCIVPKEKQRIKHG